MNLQTTQESLLKLDIGQKEFVELLKRKVDKKTRRPNLKLTENFYQGYIAGNKFYLSENTSLLGERDFYTELEGMIIENETSISIELKANSLKHVTGHFITSFALVIIGFIAATIQEDWRFLLLIPAGVVAYFVGLRTGRSIATKAIENLKHNLNQYVKSR
jgi:hypothetical protein